MHILVKNFTLIFIFLYIYTVRCFKTQSLNVSKALQELGIQPHKVIFIDDRSIHCEGAIKLGIDSILLCRDKDSYIGLIGK